MKRRGISPVVATILLIAIAVAAVAITYVWYVSFQSRMQEETERRAAEEAARQKGSIKIEKVQLDKSKKLQVWVRNTGAIKVHLDELFVTLPDGTVETKDLGNEELDPGELSSKIEYTISGTVSAGQAVTIKVVTQEGASAEASTIMPP